MAKKSSSRKSSSKAAKKTATSSAKKSAPKAAKKTAKKTAGKTARKAASKKPKSPLKKAELKEFREMLLEKRRDIIGDLNGIEAGALGKYANGDLSSLPTHLADVGSDNYEQEFSLGLMESERLMLKEIDEALERIENNTFGLCLGTGKFIGKPRLMARPWAKYCIEYARMIEQGLVRPDDDTNEPPTRDEDDDLDDEFDEIEDTDSSTDDFEDED